MTTSSSSWGSWAIMSEGKMHLQLPQLYERTSAYISLLQVPDGDWHVWQPSFSLCHVDCQQVALSCGRSMPALGLAEWFILPVVHTAAVRCIA